jgi:hypothetical protein
MAAVAVGAAAPALLRQLGTARYIRETLEAPVEEPASSPTTDSPGSEQEAVE